ncbi:hypothetical protein KBI23_03940 [bacterium]|nr:hypothetical protein [bacterium]MBP9809978.1 hypothetical protein [bacterium]
MPEVFVNNEVEKPSSTEVTKSSIDFRKIYDDNSKPGAQCRGDGISASNADNHLLPGLEITDCNRKLLAPTPHALPGSVVESSKSPESTAGSEVIKGTESVKVTESGIPAVSGDSSNSSDVESKAIGRRKHYAAPEQGNDSSFPYYKTNPDDFTPYYPEGQDGAVPYYPIEPIGPTPFDGRGWIYENYDGDAGPWFIPKRPPAPPEVPPAPPEVPPAPPEVPPAPPDVQPAPPEVPPAPPEVPPAPPEVPPAPPEVPPAPPDVQPDVPPVNPEPGDVSVENARRDVQAAAESKISDPAAKQAFLQDCADLEKRMSTDGLSAEEVSKTMEITAQLLNSDTGAVPAQDRINAAQGIMHHSAHPESVDQGFHGTCNVATVENMAFSENPSRAAQMISEVALTGQWTAPDGKQIKVDTNSLTPGAEERTFPPSDGARSYASQLYQVTALNDLGQRENPPIYFSQRRSSSRSDTGEYWTDASGKVLEPFGGLTVNEIAEESKRLLPGDNSVLIVNDGANYQDGSVSSFNSEKDLGDKLVDLKSKDDLPIIMAVNGSDPVFGGTSPENGINHVICIRDIDTSTNPPRVKIDNQWGKSSDGWMSLSDLYKGSA